MRAETIVIIGAGPAGIAAALQLKRYGLNARVLESEAIGGLLRNANVVENYPGFPRGIPGPELVRLFAEQATALGVEITYETVTELIYEADRFQIKTNAQTYTAPIVVIAAGTAPKLLGLQIPDRLREKILYEIHTLTRATGKRIAILGAGDAAFDYALNLGQRNEIFLLNRGNETNCLPLLHERAKTVANIHYLEMTRAVDLIETSDDRLLLECESAEGTLRLLVDYVIGAIGRAPQLEFVTPSLSASASELEARGKLYYAGDVKNGSFRQTAIATGDGLRTAMRIYQSLQESV